MSVSLPIRNMHVPFQIPLACSIAIDPNGGMNKVRSGFPVPESELNDFDRSPIGRSKSSPERSRIPKRLPFELGPFFRDLSERFVHLQSMQIGRFAVDAKAGGNGMLHLRGCTYTTIQSNITTYFYSVLNKLSCLTNFFLRNRVTTAIVQNAELSVLSVLCADPVIKALTMLAIVGWVPCVAHAARLCPFCKRRDRKDRSGARCWPPPIQKPAAQQAPDICGLMLVSAPGRPLGQVLREQLKANPANAPILHQVLGAIADLEARKSVDSSRLNPALLR